MTEYPETVTPTADDTLLAQASGRQVAKILGKHPRDLKIRVQADETEGESIVIPLAALKLLSSILTQMAQGNAVTLIPVHAELTTQEAAEILNVSRPFLIRLIEEGKIPHRKIGTHRRIFFSDLMEYKRHIDDARLKTLGELAKQAQELEMGY